MSQKIEQIREEFEASLASISDIAKIEEIRLEYLSKKGKIAALMGELRSIPNEEKRAFGQKVNELKTLVEEKITARREELEALAEKALAEASKALHLEYGVPLAELTAFSENLIERFRNKLLGDTVERVGRDTKRKLAKNDRLVGAALLCEKHGIAPTCILAGLAAGLHFAPAGDDSSIEIAEDAKKNGVFHALETYCGISADTAMAKEIDGCYKKISEKVFF